MLALVRLERHADALKVFDEGRTVLLAERGREPSDELRSLEELARTRRQPAEPSSMSSRATTAVLVRDENRGSPRLPNALIEAGAPAFVGREPQLARLRALLADAMLGSRRLAFVAGEPGIGKTRLVKELAEAAVRDGVTVLYGRAEDESVVPFQPFVEAMRPHVAMLSDTGLRESLRSLGPELAILLPELATVVPEWSQPSPLEPEVARYHMFEAVAGFMDAISSAGPVLLILEDLQWADPATLELLKRVGRDGDRGQLLVVGTYRSTSVASDGPLARALTRLAVGQDVAGFDLYGLDADDVAAFVAAWPDRMAPALSPERLHLRTGGNPLFLVETVRHLADAGDTGGGAAPATQPAVPATIRGVVALRLAELDRSCAQTLDVAAIIGQRFDLELLVELVSLSESEVIDALDQAIAANIIEEEAGGAGWYRFRHVIARDAIVDALGVNRAVRLHRAVGEAIESNHGDEPAARLPELARHFAAAASLGPTERERAVDYAVRAGDAAMRSLAFEDAVEYYQAALASLGPLTRSDDHVECRILLRLRDAESRAGDESGAAVSLQRLMELTSARPAAGGLSFLLDPQSWRPPPWGYGTELEAGASST
jgi:predicted ATPase